MMASAVVFLVALPLCLGIALASGASPLSGLIAGIVGGIVIGSISSSPLSVSGPAAGLIVIVLAAIEDLGSYQAFLVAVILAGLLQIVFGALRAGKVSNYFPSSVIKGMLAAIGLTLILKQIPHLIGFDMDAFGEMEFFQKDGETTITELSVALQHITPGAVIIGFFSLFFLIAWDKLITVKFPAARQVPGSFVVVILAILINVALQSGAPDLALFSGHLVALPRLSGSGLSGQLIFPDFSVLKNPDVYIIAGTLAIVGSLESLLSAEAVERLDPENRKSESNRELFAQGIGNTLSGLIGGLPVTAVIVRSSANLSAGATSKLSAIMHGVWLLVAVLLIPGVLNLIPLSALAAVLILVGYKLTKPSLVKEQYDLGIRQFIPFIVTLVAIFLSDLLIGILIGLVTGMIFILIDNYRIPFFYQEKQGVTASGKKTITITLSEQVTFLNKASLLNAFAEVPDGSELTIDGGTAQSIDLDVLEVIHLFSNESQMRNITCRLVNIPPLPGDLPG